MAILCRHPAPVYGRTIPMTARTLNPPESARVDPSAKHTEHFTVCVFWVEHSTAKVHQQ